VIAQIRRARVAAVAAASAFAVGAIGGALTQIGPWYRALKKPAWTPPDLAFPIIWTTILTLTAIAGALGWRASTTPRARSAVIGLFAVNGALNALWSLLFFTLKKPSLALVEAGALWLSIAALIALLVARSRPAAALLLPYLAWVAVAFYLNAEIVRLNPALS